MRDGVDIGEFDPDQTDYEGVIAEGVTTTIVTAEAMQRRTVVEIAPDDADENADGHQVTLAGVSEITVTVTSADATRERTYRVAFEPTATELELGPRWTSFEWPGADGTGIAEAGLPEEVVAVYTWDEPTARGSGTSPACKTCPA